MSLSQTGCKPNTLYVYRQTTGLASNRSAHFGIRKQIITKLRATDSIVNTERGCFIVAIGISLQNKIIMLESFLD